MGKDKASLQVIEVTAIRTSYIDPDSEKVVKVNEEQARELAALEIQLAASVTNLILTLKKVRDSKLYLLRSDTFDEYVRMIGLAPRTAYRQLQIADTFGSSKHFEDLQRLPQSILLEAAKNDDLVQQLNDGEVKTHDGEILTIKEIVDSGAVKLRAELEKYKKSSANFKSKFEAADEERKLFASELEGWKEKIGPENFQRISKKKDAMAALFAADGEIANAIRSLNSIESDDPEVISKIGAVIGLLQYGAEGLQDKWMPHLVKASEA